MFRPPTRRQPLATASHSITSFDATAGFIAATILAVAGVIVYEGLRRLETMPVRPAAC